MAVATLIHEGDLMTINRHAPWYPGRTLDSPNIVDSLLVRLGILVPSFSFKKPSSWWTRPFWAYTGALVPVQTSPGRSLFLAARPDLDHLVFPDVVVTDRRKIDLRVR